MSTATPGAGPPVPVEIVVDANGYATCPDCEESVHCGTGGVGNLRKRHMGSKPCLAAQAKKLTTQNKQFHDSKISGWLVPKPVRVPTTVAAPAPIQVIAAYAPRKLIPPSHSRDSPPPTASLNARSASSSLLTQLEAAIQTVPSTVPEATDGDVLAASSQDPAHYVDPDVPAIEIFENLNSILHTTLGWAMPVEETAGLLRRGAKGLDGLLRFFRYFVEDRGVREQDFGSKIQQILRAIEFLAPELPLPASTEPAISAAPTDTSHNPESDSDDIQIVAHLTARALRAPRVACEGFVFPLGRDQSISTAYPILLHDQFNLPWDFAVRRGVLYLTARTCTRKQRAGHSNCTPCADLEKNSMLKGMISRSAEGVHENANLMYQPPAALVEIVRQKNVLIQSLRLRLLTNARNLLTQTKSLSDHKRFVLAIGSGKVQRVDRVVGACIKQKRGLRGMFDAYLRASKGHYNPAKSEEDDMIGVAILKLAGIRVAEICHPSPGAPLVEEIQKNIDACFAGITESLASKRVVHQIIMFDEIATEKRVRWDPTTNHFLGICRQHAHKVGLEFNGERDLDELFEALEKKVNSRGKLDSLVHNAAEVTVAALGIMSEDTRLYSARPILISGDCKRETGAEHAKNVLDPVICAVDSKKELTRLRTICLASDGETRRGSAFIIKTFKHKLPTTSKIYAMLKDLRFMNFMVGDDDLTADKDPKHVDKRFRNGFLRERGIKVLDIHLTPAIMRTHFQSTGHTADHIRSVFNPEDKQDVRLAFEMLKDIWSLPPSPPGTSPGVAAAREALRTLGKLLYHFVSPYICVDFSLSEQLEHLSAAAHLALVLFRKEGKHFMASLLCTDMMMIIKNVYFCVAKAKVDDPLGKFWLILLGTDRLEELFGILRTMVGNDANCDILQMLDRLRGTIEVSTILTKYPHWDRAPRRLRLPAMTREGKELSDHVDIKPASVRGDMRVQEVTPLTCWKRGRRLVEAECPWAIEILQGLDATPGVDILSPFGQLLFDAPLDPDDNEDEDIEVSAGPALPPHPLSTELEDAAEEELEAFEAGSPMRVPSTISHSITVDGSSVRKARALAQRLKYGKKKVSTDRNRRVAGVSRHSGASVIDSGITEFDSLFGGPCLMISDVIATLVRCEDRIFLCLGEVNAIHLSSESLDSLGLDVLPEKTATVSFQFLKIIPATTIDDLSNTHDWKSAGLLSQTLKVPGRMVQPLDPRLSTAQIGNPHYLFESNSLRILTASLFEQLTPQNLLLVPAVTSNKFFPYREGGGRACFVCEFNDNSRPVEAAHICAVCPPSAPVDLKQGLRVLAHNAAHILFDPAVDWSTHPCGICLNPAPMCRIVLTTSGTKKIDKAKSKCPNLAATFTYSIAAQSTEGSPFSNVPLDCTLCGSGAPTIWRYNYRYHLRDSHPTAPVAKYASIWQLTPVERTAAETLWNTKSFGNGIAVPKKRDPKTTELSISEPHSSRLSMRPATLAAPLDDSELTQFLRDTPEEPEPEADYEGDGTAAIAAIPRLNTQDLETSPELPSVGMNQPSDVEPEEAVGLQSSVDMPSSSDAGVASATITSQVHKKLSVIGIIIAQGFI
ncbi:hypothetical protein DFH09DRAFT_1327969 [Mycena vulgaris]|nr:hypothetical protein DFH09DRAFT_1327969 [Mycena vulgaris]